MQTVYEQLYVPSGNLIEIHRAEVWKNAGFENLEIGPARAGFAVTHELRNVVILNVGVHRYYHTWRADDHRLHLGNDLLEPALCLPLRDFIFISEVL